MIGTKQPVCNNNLVEMISTFNQNYVACLQTISKYFFVLSHYFVH